MTTTTATEAEGPGIDWAEERWLACREHLPHLIEDPPTDDDDIADRTRAVDFAAQRARELTAAYPTAAPGASARGLLDALAEVRRREPRAKGDPKGVPQSVAAVASLASELANDPTAADRIDAGLAAAIDRTLGRRIVGAYKADVADAHERLATGCEEILATIPVEWRRLAAAPTRTERADMEAATEAMGVDLR